MMSFLGKVVTERTYHFGFASCQRFGSSLPTGAPPHELRDCQIGNDLIAHVKEGRQLTSHSLQTELRLHRTNHPTICI